MRPVNLIPPEERRGDHAPTRTGPLAYLILGVLAAAVLAVTGIVLTNNQIADRKTQVSQLHAQVAQATAEAGRLQSYADFATIGETRTATVTTLAKSRFDWDRVLRELALVIPSDVWLTDLSGSVSPAAAAANSGSAPSSTSNAGAAALTDQITGPALSISGCAAGHDAVARFLGALKDIDGVTRVAVTSSERPSSSAAGAVGGGGAGDCAVRDFIANFQVVVTFDKVPIDATTGLATPAAPAASSPTAAPAAAPAAGATAGVAGLAGVRREEVQHRRSVKQQTAKAHQAASTLIPGTVRP